MTKRDFLTMVSEGNINDEIMAEATKWLDSMDKANAAKAKKSAEKKALVNAPIVEAITYYLTNHPDTTSADLAVAVSEVLGEVVSCPKVLGVMRNLPQFESHEVAVKGKGKQRAWNIVAVEDED